MNYLKSALLLENIDRGPTYAALQANGFYIFKRMLKSSESNWIKICEILEQDVNDEIVVISKLNEWILGNYFLNESYKEVMPRLIRNILNKRHLIFIYSDNYEGNFNFNYGYVGPDDDRNVNSEFDPDLEALIQYFIQCELNLMSYKTIVDLEIAAQGFIENISQGLLLRFYIPNEKFGSVELDKFIILFKDFISTVTHNSISISQNRTKYGITCTLYSESNEVKQDDLYKLLDDFTVFMDLCVNNPDAAEGILLQNDVPKEKIAQIINKHVKEANRMLLDLKQDKERRLLNARQRFESEILETKLDATLLLRSAESMAPQIIDFKDLIFEKKIETINININPQIIHKVEGIVNKEFSGTVNFTHEDEQILSLIQKYIENNSRACELVSALYEIKDDEISLKVRNEASSKLKNFLLKFGEKIGDVGFKLLTKYLEDKLGLNG